MSHVPFCKGFISISYHERAYQTILYSILCVVSIHTACIFASDLTPTDLRAPGAPLEQKNQQCPCFDCGQLWFPGPEHPFSPVEQEIAETLARLPIAIESKSQDQSARTFPLLELILDYSGPLKQWLLFNKINFKKIFVRRMVEVTQTILVKNVHVLGVLDSPGCITGLGLEYDWLDSE